MKSVGASRPCEKICENMCAFYVALEIATWEPLEMCKVAMVCKEAQAHMARAWPRIAPPSYSQDRSDIVICQDCGDTKKDTKAWGRCSQCIRKMKLISATQAKKDFYLKPDMLYLLEHKESQSMYNRRQVVCMYVWREVVELALRVHKGPKGLLQRKQPSKAKLTRKLAIEKHMRDGGALHAMTSPEAWTKCAAPFVASGVGGVSGVIRAFKQFTHQQQRKEALQAALQAHGLTLRADSRLCKAFIEETKGNKTLAETVQIMREMDWLHKNTNYAQRMRDACRNICIRSDGEWIPQPLYDELCAEEREKISAKLRRIMVPPNFC